MQKKDTTLIIIALLLAAGIFLLMPEKRNSPGDASHASVKQQAAEMAPILDPRAIEKQIDIQMKIGRQSEELRRDLMALENKIQDPQIDPSQIDMPAYNESQPIPLQLNSEGDAARVYRETIENKRDDRALTPDQRLTNKINRDEWERDYREAYEREYVRQYVENARKAGYSITLNEKGEIIQVIEIGKNEAVRFPQAVEQSGEKATPGGQQ
jgi:hypothetical protein